MKKTWEESAYDVIVEKLSATPGRMISYRTLLEDLEQMVDSTKSGGKTPDKTLSRTLQLLRDRGVIEFTSPGQYTFIQSTEFADNASLGHKLVRQALRKIGIDAEEEKTFPDLFSHRFRRLRFDFYGAVGGVRFAIEYDGKQHFAPVSHFGGWDALVALQCRDAQKNDYCNVNNIELLRIPYTIKNWRNVSRVVEQFITAIFHIWFFSLIGVDLRMKRLTT